MKIGIGNDHAAVQLKNEMVKYLQEKGFECVDYGSTDPASKDDYPDFGLKVAEALMNGEVEKGVLICGTGIGIALAANKVPGIRAASVSDPASARLSVQHNNCNIISFGERIVGVELAKDILDAFFNAKFLGEPGSRHERRVSKIGEIEKKYNSRS
jgi:ribose 5-phosphate isomerase B